MTTEEADIIKHSLGWPKNYRNYFAADPGTGDYAMCEKLVCDGLMVRNDVSSDSGIVYFFVTAKGRRVVGCERKASRPGGKGA